jgi:hypothetical protein
MLAFYLWNRITQSINLCVKILLICDVYSGIVSKVPIKFRGKNSIHRPGVMMNQAQNSIPQHTPDLSIFERAGYFSLQGRDVIWNVSDSLLSSRALPVIHPCKDLLAQLSEPGLAPMQRMTLRVQLCGQNHAWRMLPALWADAQTSQLDQDPQVHRSFARQVAIAARGLALNETPLFPSELWGLLTTLTSKQAYADPLFSIAVSQAFSLLLRTAQAETELKSTLIEKILVSAPLGWLEAFVSTIDEANEEEPNTVTVHRHAFIRSAAEDYPNSASLLRAVIRTYSSDASERLALERRLLALADATFEDFIHAARNAAMRTDIVRAKALLAEAERLFAQ